MSHQEDATDVWLTVAEVARMQQVHPKTVLRWIAAERLPAERIGHHWRIRRSALHRMLTEERPS